MNRHQSKLLNVLNSVVMVMVLFTSCAEIVLLKDTPIQSNDEEAIVSLLSTYQERVNSYKWDKLPELYTDDGMLGNMNPKEFIEKNMRGLQKFEDGKCKAIFRAPKSMSIEENSATVILDRNISCNNKINELNIELAKSNGIWLIKNFKRK